MKEGRSGGVSLYSYHSIQRAKRVHFEVNLDSSCDLVSDLDPRDEEF